MTTTLRRLFGISLLAFAAAAQVSTAAARAQGQQPRPEVRQLVDAFIETVNGADPAADKFVKEHFTPEYQKARTVEERRTWFQNIRAKHGKVTLTGLRRISPETFVIALSAEKGGNVEFEVTHTDTFKVSALGLNQAGGQ